MQRWEYRTVYIHTTGGILSPGKLDALFNELGKEGWQLVSVQFTHAYFMRPKQHDPVL